MKFAKFRKILSIIIVCCFVFGTVIVPTEVSAEKKAPFSYNKYIFSESSGTIYSGSLADSSGEIREISRAHFERSKNDELHIFNNLQVTNASTSGYLFNDKLGFFELQPETMYSVNLKVKVVSSQVLFKKGTVSYPLGSQVTELKLAYGMPKVNSANKITMDADVGLVAKIGTEADTFTAVQDGSEKDYSVGEWHSFTYTFTTPATFGENGNVLGLALKSFNGIDILVDDVRVSKVSHINLVASPGKVTNASVNTIVGEKLDLENAAYKFGYDFSGWYYDKECTKKFTDEYVTEENCDLTLYAGYSATNFGFEGFVNVSTYGLGKQFMTIKESEDAPQGKKLLHYHYTKEFYNQIYSGSAETGNIVYYSTRRTQRENNIPIKYVEPNTSYVVTFKYKVKEGAAPINVSISTGHENIWVPGCYVDYPESKIVLTDKNSGEWRTARVAFTTGALDYVSGMRGRVAYIMLHASIHKDTEMFIDDILIEKVEGSTDITLVANGGIFRNGQSVKSVTGNVGDYIDTLEAPIRENFDFNGWYFDANCTIPVDTEKIDGSIYLNTLYASWSSDVDFEGYYYDLESDNRENYLSKNVSIVKENAKKGSYSAKLVNNGGKRNVIALNPIYNNKTRYLITFNYSLIDASTDVNVKFATMNYSINNQSEVKIYDEVYKISAQDAGEGYIMGAVIVETDFANKGCNRLAMLIQGTNSGTYTVYFDSVSVKMLGKDEGYIILTDKKTGNDKAVIGDIGDTVKVEEPISIHNKFLGWYNDKNYTTLYDESYEYSDKFNRIYANWAMGEGYEDYESSNQNVIVTTDPDDKYNKYLTLKNTVAFKIGEAVSGKKYAVDLRYNLVSATNDVSVKVGSYTVKLSASTAGTGWHFTTFYIPSATSVLNIITSLNDASLLIDDVVIYEVTDQMSVITFDQADGYGEDSVRVGVKGTSIILPENPAHPTDAFYGWFSDASLTTPFVATTFTDGDITVYGKWSKNPIDFVGFEGIDLNDPPYNATNSNMASITNSTKSSGTYSLLLDRTSEEEYETYMPLFTADGYVKLESNAVYAISYRCYFPAYSSGNTVKFAFYTANATYDSPKIAGKTLSCPYATSWRSQYTSFTTGDLGEDNYLYIAVTGGNKKNKFYVDDIRITRIDEGRNHVFAYDPMGRKMYETDGNYGELIKYPEISGSYYEIEGWYEDSGLTVHHDSGTHNAEPITELTCRWDLKDIDFETYQYESSTSKYTLGDDVSVSADEAYDTFRSLKYSYNFTYNYFETANNTAGLGRVDDNSTYRISFKYKLKSSQSDVDIKFLTAHLTNRWSFITDYEEATYRIYSGEAGDDWKEATVYLTTKFASIGTSGLFMTFNPVVEGETELYIDAVDVDYMRDNVAIAAYMGKDNSVYRFVESRTGRTVSAPDFIPSAHLAEFEGWYNDKECTEEFTEKTLETGINYIYSSWTENTESFENYTYTSNSFANYSQNNVVKDGILTYTRTEANTSLADVFRIGKVNNNTTYKISFDYKTNSDGIKVKFATANEMDISENTTAYNDEGCFIKAENDGQWHTATAYITTAFAYNVPKDGNEDNAENKKAFFGDMLYMYFENGANAEISIDNIKLKEIEVVSQRGYSVLTDEVSREIGKQALRFYFSYPTKNIITVEIDGESFNLVERGMIFKNAKNTVTGKAEGDKINVSAITLDCKDKPGHTVISKTGAFNQYWNYDNKTESVVYSGYIKDFNINDIRLIGVRGYIKVKDDAGNIYTFYSADEKTTVKEVADINSEYTDKEVHTFGGVTWDNFTIVNPKLMPYIYGRQIEFLIDYAKTVHNVTLNRVTEKAAETSFEIVIGDTKRATSNLVSVEKEDQYVIAMRGNKLIIKGGSDLAVMQGVKDFIDYLKMKDSLGCGADLVDGYTKFGTVSKTEDDYKLVLNENFDGTKLNPVLWGAYYNQTKNQYAQKNATVYGGVYYTYCPTDGGYTTASGMVVDDAMFVRDGNCVLTTARINDTDFVGSELSTFWHMIYQYGYCEINCKLSEPPSHSGWWMNGAATGDTSFVSLFGRESRGCMTEYDLIENFGIHNYYAANIHYWWSSTGNNDRGHSSLDGVADAVAKNQYYVPDDDEEDMYSDYHILTFLWENDKIVFALDGVKFYEFYNNSTYYDRMPNYINLGQGMGGKNYGKSYDKNIHKDYYETLLDYVRIYQMESMGSRMVWANY